jgi:hypothetical protein
MDWESKSEESPVFNHSPIVALDLDISVVERGARSG